MFPSRIELGQAVTVSLGIQLECPGDPLPLEVALVIDRSPSMKGQALADARDAAIAFLDLLDLDHHRIGVASFHDSATVEARLSGDRRYLRSAIQSLEVPLRGNTDIADGLRAGERVLTDGRAREGAGRVLVLLSDGKNKLGRPPVLQSAALLRANGVHIVTMALGGAADAELLAAIATSPNDALHAPFSRDLGAVFAGLATRMQSVAATDVHIDDPLPESLVYVPHSSSPAAVYDGSELRWLLPLATTDVTTLTWRVRPTRIGRQPVSAGGWLAYQDTAGRPGRAALPQGWVEVFAEGALPIPTAPNPTSPTPTLSATLRPGVGTPGSPATPTDPPPEATVDPGSATADPRATTTPSGSATRPVGATPIGTSAPRPPIHPPSARHTRYLPLVGASLCRSRARSLDVVLLLDASTTMRLPARDGRPRIELAAEAARGLATRLLGPGGATRLGLVAFDELPRTLLAPTSDVLAVRTRLDQGIRTARGSRIDLGIEHAARLLAALPDREGREAQPVLILLTDGQVVDASDERVLDVAAAARDAGVELWTLALGSDARRDLLALIAGRPDRAFDSADDPSMVAALLELAGRLACP